MKIDTIEIPLKKATYEELQQAIFQLQIEKWFYKNKVDRALEYIENNTITIYGNDYIKINNIHYVDDLESILKGE